MERLTNQEVIEQKERFDLLMSKVDLIKAGKKIINLIQQDKSDFNFITRYLKICGVHASMYYPETKNHFYREIFERQAIIAYCESKILIKQK